MAFDRFVHVIGTGERVSFWWTMGVNQSHEATRTAQAIINLALMTGSIGRPGTGANSITGQCNAMGSRLFSNTTGLVDCHAHLSHFDLALDQLERSLARGGIELLLSAVERLRCFGHEHLGGVGTLA